MRQCAAIKEKLSTTDNFIGQLWSFIDKNTLIFENSEKDRWWMNETNKHYMREAESIIYR